MSELAINGGNPTRTRPFPTWPVWDEREEHALLDVLRSGVWGALDPDRSKVAQFEMAFARSHHAGHGLCVTNGSHALEVALLAAGVGLGDEVIVPAYTFIATASACLMVGAVPVFADIDPGSYNIDPASVEDAVTDRTKAIIPVHIGGRPADMDRILAIGQSHGLTVIEDACQAHAASWKGSRVGSMGDMGCFSFQASKNINAGEGGIILTQSDALADRVWSIRNCGRVREGRWYQHENVGFNYRMTEWQGAILLAQLSRMEDLARRREANASYLSGRLAEIGGITPQAGDPRVTQHAYHLYIFRYDAASFEGLDRAAFLAALKAEGIPCSKGYDPLYRTRAIQRAVVGLRASLFSDQSDYQMPDCPVTERACDEEGVWLTQNLLLGSEDDMDDIVRAIAKIQKNAGSAPSEA